MRILILALMLSGCATHSLQNPYDFSGFDNNRLCKSAKWVKATNNNDGVINPYLAENSKRNLLTESEFNDVFKRSAQPGDSSCFVVATGGDAKLIEQNLKEQNPNQYNYKLGMQDGCESGKFASGTPGHAQSKNVDLYVNNAYYKNGYDDAYDKCKTEGDQLKRAITDSLNRGW